MMSLSNISNIHDSKVLKLKASLSLYEDIFCYCFCHRGLAISPSSAGQHHEESLSMVSLHSQKPKLCST